MSASASSLDPAHDPTEIVHQAEIAFRSNDHLLGVFARAPALLRALCGLSVEQERALWSDPLPSLAGGLLYLYRNLVGARGERWMLLTAIAHICVFTHLVELPSLPHRSPLH
jgi:hypothetical protein